MQLILYYVNKMGSLSVVQLSLRSGFPQAFGIACVLPSHCLTLINLVPSSPCGTREIRKALPILLFYPSLVGGIGENCIFRALP